MNKNTRYIWYGHWDQHIQLRINCTKSILGRVLYMKLKAIKVKSIKSKLTVSMISICVISVLALGIASYLQTKSLLAKKLEVTSKQTLSEVNSSLNNYFEGISVQMKMAANNVNFSEIDLSEGRIEFTKKYLEDMKKSSETIIRTFYGTESGKFAIYPQVELGNDFSYKSRDWYTLAVNNKGKTVFTDPYKDIVTNKITITAARAVELNGKLVGVAAMDLSLDVLSDTFSKSKVGETGYISIFDKKGIIISHPNKEFIGTDTPTKQSFWKEVKENKSGFISYSFEGQSKFASYATNEVAGWKLLGTMNESELLKDVNTIKYLIFVTILVVTVLASIIAFLLSRGIGNNINRIKTSFSKAAQGDLTTVVDIKSEDELGELGNDFNLMMLNISNLMKNLGLSSKTILEASSNIAGMSEETTASINEVSKAIGEISQGATNQAQNAQQGASNMGELAQKLDQITESTIEVSEISSETQKLSSKGLQMVETLTLKSEIAKKSSEHVSGIVEEVNNSISQITSISESISQITEQTNLLSLNASIEAARAGEAGRGFAVVADEIRKLAEQSRNSTEEIKKIVEDIQSKSMTAVSAMGNSESIIKEQEEAVIETKEIFNNIINGVILLTDKISKIQYSITDINGNKNIVASQIQDISGVSEEIASGTEEVSAATEEVNSTMDELTKYAEDLQELAEKLQEEMNKFKVN